MRKVPVLTRRSEKVKALNESSVQRLGVIPRETSSKTTPLSVNCPELATLSLRAVVNCAPPSTVNSSLLSR